MILSKAAKGVVVLDDTFFVTRVNFFLPGTLFQLQRNLLDNPNLCAVMSLELQMCLIVQPSSDVKVLLINSSLCLQVRRADSAPCFYAATECFRQGIVD
ncbi:uncharacterized protein LOC124342901 isoform X3 [Daphnia pulicaria]|uniref:uncharacterized protein LOC124342901 isoform X3 n=1 Tax=Daphnia pulicaria TaxID=35523 RepID=UPI001EEB182F|nr:uncharacterized protein LOC124342901 isoform X3 [Daphnia pulicaria]